MPSYHYNEVFQSVHEFADRVKAMPVVNSSYESTLSPSDFNYYTSFEKSIELTSTGWMDGVARASKISSPVVDAICSKIERLDVVHDTEGIGIDIARYVEDEPECWQRFEQTIVEGRGNRVITLVFNGTTSSAVGTDVIIAKGATVSALIQSLEYAGYRVEVWYANASENSSYEYRIKVKSADQEIDFPRLVYVLAHPGFYRQLCFRYLKRIPKKDAPQLDSVRQSGMIGSPAETNFQGDIYIGMSHSYFHQWNSPELAQTWIIEQLKKQGVTLHE